MDGKFEDMASRVWTNHIWTDDAQRQQNQDKWLKAMSYLGDRWILASDSKHVGFLRGPNAKRNH